MKYIPIFQIIATLSLCFVSMDNLFYIFLSNIIGYSILTSIFFAYYLRNEKEVYIRLAPYFLILINVFNIVGIFIDYAIYEKSYIILLLTIYTITSLWHYPE